MFRLAAALLTRPLGFSDPILYCIVLVLTDVSVHLQCDEKTAQKQNTTAFRFFKNIFTLRYCFLFFVLNVYNLIFK